MMRKRLERELKTIPYTYTVGPYFSTIDFEVPPVGTIQMTDLDSYPFKGPKIYINGKSYSSFLAFPGKYTEDLYKKTFPSPCCRKCASFDCPGRWSLFSKLEDIIKEVMVFRARKEWVYYHLFFTKLRDTYNLPSDIPFEGFVVMSNIT